MYVQIISVNHKLRLQPAVNALMGFFVPLEHHDFSDGESPSYGHLRLTTATHLLFKASAGKEAEAAQTEDKPKEYTKTQDKLNKDYF